MLPNIVIFNNANELGCVIANCNNVLNERVSFENIWLFLNTDL